MCGFLFLFSIVVFAGCGSSGDAPSDTTDSTGTDTSFTSTVELLDGTGGAIRTISEGNPGTLKVTVTTKSGAAAVDQFLTVTTSKGSFLNSDGTAMTNASGVAEFTLIADGANGAGTIDVAVGDSTLDTPFAFQIGAPESVKLGAFVNGSFQEGILLSSIATGEKLSIGGTATITAALAILDGSAYVPYTQSVDISFSTLCATAVVDQTVSTENGIATTTYRGVGCTSGADTVTATASIAGSSLSASTDLSLATPEVGSITFDSAVPERLALAGTSNTQFPTISIITFTVKDEVGNPVPNELVNFSLSPQQGSISLSPSSAETNSAGQVLVTISSGNVPTSVRVRATVNDSQISTVSSNLVISTGLADQNSFSISATPFNPEGWNIDGVTVAVTVRAADHFNNPVPDGTSIYFTTEGGVIDPTCSTVNGACSVEWRSQDPRPGNGRVTILATALGEESFIDANGSGRYESSADILGDDMDEAFVDADEDGIRDVDEEFMDYNKDLLFTEKNGMYNGTLCVTGCSEELIHVRESIVLSMSSSWAAITINPSTITLNGLVSVFLTIADINGNSMPGGTAVALTAPANATIEGESSFEIINTTTFPSVFSFALKPDGTSDPGTTSTLQVKVTSPSGAITTGSALCITP
ncbi:MAG: Ig-like domain-containing protein [Desulfobacterium sp.]|nr:Ig-like domain-containing protein [Desulfobacterium sp.]